MSETYRNPEWLATKYLNEGRDANAIGRMVGRDGKTVWSWLKKFGIETRKRGYAGSATWRKPGEPSSFKGRRHSDETRAKLRKIAIADGRVPFDRSVGSYMKGRSGSDVHNWKGGVTPERQSFYASKAWKSVVPLVWKRDNATCQRCGLKNVKKQRYAFDIHHIVGFENRELRAALSNLVLLCERCHYWVHSNENTEKLFIKEIACC